jgi:hypothetical protein
MARAFDEAGGGTDQHQALRRVAGLGQAFGDARLAIGAEREAGQRDRDIAAPALGVFDDRQQVVGFATPSSCTPSVPPTPRKFGRKAA